MIKKKHPRSGAPAHAASCVGHRGIKLSHAPNPLSHLYANCGRLYLLWTLLCLWHFFFFFQADDGIRDFHVTGVQTCALPISPRHDRLMAAAKMLRRFAKCWRG